MVTLRKALEIGDKYYLTHYTNVVLCASAYNEVQYSTLSE